MFMSPGNISLTSAPSKAMYLPEETAVYILLKGLILQEDFMFIFTSNLVPTTTKVSDNQGGQWNTLEVI